MDKVNLTITIIQAVIMIGALAVVWYHRKK